MYWPKQLTLISILVFTFQAYGNDSKPAEAQKAKEGDKAAPEEKKFSGAQNEEWAKAQKDVQTAKIKYENDKKLLEDLKRAVESQESLTKESLAKINEATKTMKASEANYQRFVNQYNLRFPEKGLDVGRKYKRSDAERDGIETVEEKPQGIEAKLRRLHRNIKYQYQGGAETTSNGADQKKKPKKKQGSGESSETLQQPAADDVTEKITIEK